jgi:hypothetical protein
MRDLRTDIPRQAYPRMEVICTISMLRLIRRSAARYLRIQKEALGRPCPSPSRASQRSLEQQLKPFIHMVA